MTAASQVRKHPAKFGFAGRWADLAHSIARSRLAVLGLVLFACILILALTAPWIAPHDPLEQELGETLMPPFWETGGSAKYLLGSDHLGRDILSRLLYGANVSLRVAGFASLFSLIFGVAVGLAAGYAGGWVEAALMRGVDVFLAFPLILLALALAAILGPSITNLIIVMTLTGWMIYARIVRSSVLSIKNQEYIDAARAVGATHARILFRHILPNLVAPALVLFTFGFAQFIILESALSFLGLGVPPPEPTWGRMLYDGRDVLTVAPWVITFPGLAIMVTVLCVNFIGDGLRDALDPRLRRLA
ncbi:MAG: ABC transporter permease [Anaerolineae bacterium]|nr:ABC transporter permease [Anaerolineae bacterium]